MICNRKFISRLRPIVACATILAYASISPAETLQALALPAGYTSSTVELGLPYAGAIAFAPAPSTRFYAAVGGFGSMDILSVDTDTGTTRTVADGFGSIGGMAVLANGDLFIAENFTSDTLYRARDLDLDGKFYSAGEVTELIAPDFHDGNFSGAQIIIAPAGNPSGIPSGSLVLQTADGGTSGELLVIQNPTGTASYFPTDAPFADGLAYNGGVAFEPGGALIVGSAGFLSGEILAMVNTNNNDRIDAGERNVVVPSISLGLGVSDLSVSAESVVYFGENSGNLKSFNLPYPLLTGSAVPAQFAQTNSAYLSTVRLDFPERTFAANAASPTAKLYLGGYLGGFVPASNLIVIEPLNTAAVTDWQAFE
ncbi:hypothetical protein CVU37_12050 [candidate division BRC1 bacterium HGW-BRC1-1]|jgi:hypothetical protein|nr:MAG: hypothetical protein CVU37_12050 [candidate division BRC1 bacterium HGW-BRC1-1]